MGVSGSATTTATTAGEGELPMKPPLTILWALCTILWSVFHPPQFTYAVRVLLFQPTWGVRMLLGEPTWTQDLALCLGTHLVYSYFAGHWRIPKRGDFDWMDPKDDMMHLYYQTFSLLAACGLLAGSIVFRGHHIQAEAQDDRLCTQRIDEQVLPPLLLTSRTTHSRVFPKKHGFSYSYLLVGIPVGTQGRINRSLSVDTQRPAWFHIDSTDFLNRGNAHTTLAEKLRAYLHTHGVTDRDYAFAYLVAAPKCLGYSFNPVSFWYVYDSDTRLRYMVLEVNNTFGERRMYLLKGGSEKDEVMEIDPETHTNGSSSDMTRAPKQLTFSDTWMKDFHVSPFNSREGSYSLRATDPLATYETTGKVRIDNTIVLRSSKDQPKIVARVYSEGEPRDPAEVSVLEALNFIGTWCWVGFATFPRIVWQASRLFFRQKLHVWYRPEVTDSSISRPYTEDEVQLEAFFRTFLTTAVNESSRPLRVVYEPAHPEGTEIVLYSPSYTYEEDHKHTLTLKVLSPAFYSRFVHYNDVKEGLEKECLVGDGKNRTAIIEHTDLLPDLLAAITEQSQTGAKDQSYRLGSLEQVRWACMRRLRCPPASPAYPSETSTNTHHVTRALSELETSVIAHGFEPDTYRRVTTKLFLAERMTFGIPALLVVLDIMVRSGLLLTSMIYSDRAGTLDVFRPRKLGSDDIGTVVATLVLANSVHIWGFLKG